MERDCPESSCRPCSCVSVWLLICIGNQLFLPLFPLLLGSDFRGEDVERRTVNTGDGLLGATLTTPSGHFNNGPVRTSMEPTLRQFESSHFYMYFFFGRCILDRNQRTSQKKRERERKGGKNRKKRKESTRAVLFSFLSSIMGFIFWPSVVSSVVSSVVCAGGGKWPPRAVTLTLAAHVWKLERGPSYWKRDRRRSNSKPTRMNGRGKNPTKKRKEKKRKRECNSSRV